MFKFALSVRAYNEARKYGHLPAYTDWRACDDEALRLACAWAGLDAFYKKGRLKTGCELLRAGGYGVHAIYTLAYYGHKTVTLDEVRALCEKYDKSPHEAL